MIISLIDKLNKSADEWNGNNMFELARMCHEAADTIWELRDDLQRANAENAKLREYANLMHGLIKECCDACGERSICDVDALTRSLGIEVEE